MTPEIGHFALWLALGVALVQGTVPLAGAARGRADWMALARRGAVVQCALVAFAYACLTAAFVANDYSLAYVADHSNSALPLAYRVAGVWGGHEGSLLLWVLMLAGWSLAVALGSRALPLPFVARTLAVMGWIAVGFLLFMLCTSNPFERVFPAPADGRDLNPLLQDPGMVVHPPMLYMGYVGFSVAFAFALAALIGGRLDHAWARWTRPWTTAAWSFLTIGIALGSWWAYDVLGWGGWWFWDPVENASFMPWLAGTALIHSLAVTEKRGAFKSWTVLLAIVTFSLSLLGTFLVRSGVLTSVHAFATDPQRGLFILLFLAVAVGGSLALYAWRAPQVGLGGRFEPVSRESLLLANNVLFVVAMLSVLLGTLYPLAIDALGAGKISVGPPYFEAVFVPLMVPVVFLLGIGPLARWKQASLPDLASRLKWAAAAAVVAALATGWVAGRITLGATLGLLMAWWIVAALAVDLLERARSAAGLRSITLATAGMMAAHLGIAVFAFGVSMVKTYEVERDVQLSPGHGVVVAGREFVFRGTRPARGPNYEAIEGVIEVRGDGAVPLELHPQKRVYRVQRNPMTEAAIHRGVTRDLYVSLGEPVGNGGAWTLRLYVKPFVNFLWLACTLMALGGFLAIADRRYRVRRASAQGTAAAEAAA